MVLAQNDDEAFSDLESGLDAAWAAVREQATPEVVASRYAAAARGATRIEAMSATLDADARARALDDCARRIERLDERARAILNDPRIEDGVLARSIATLRGEARLTRRVTRAVSGLPPLDEPAFRLAELQDAENALASHDRAPQSASLEPFDAADPKSAGAGGALDADRRQLRDARFEILSHQAERRLAEAQAVIAIDASNAASTFSLYRLLDSTHRELDARRVEIGEQRIEPLIARIETERGRLEQAFFRFVESVDDPAGLAIVRRAASALERELDEARVIGLEPATPARVARLRRLQLVGERFLRTANAALDRRNAPTPNELIGLKKVLRTVRHVVNDRVLELRLHRVFGARTVATWDRLVFWLIVSVLLLLFIDHYRDPDPPGHIHWTIWVDTGICAVLLLDFFVRTFLAPQSLSYFRRHFLTELLPALPYGLLANLEHLTAAQSLRTIRIVRTLTFLQALRPIIRIGRLFLFVSRAADRVVDQNAWLLNRNIVFFADVAADEGVPTLVKRARELEAFISRQSVSAAAELDYEDARLSAATRRVVVAVENECDGLDATGRSFPSDAVETKLLDVEDVIHRLRDLDASQVAEFVGTEFAQQITDSLRFFRLPWLRRIPVVSFILGESGTPDPLAVTARLGRVCGDLLDVAQRAVNWFADLYGTITPSQFLDRLGTQIVKATARPTRRLILFGLIMLLVMGLVELTRFEFLDRTATFINKFLTLPVLALGFACAIPLALGTWFRNIARQAADFYDRIAEAQFLALTEVLKEETREDDLRYLAERVVAPEARLAGASGAIVATLVDDFARRGCSFGDGRAGPISLEPSRFDIAYLFHRDFLDGAYFHRNDVKVANLLLGNLTLENVRRNRLRFSKREWKRLDRIDIGRGKGGVAGASVWFHCITHSVSQNVARLVLEYNRHCIPECELATATPIDREKFDRWLASRERQSEALARGEAVLPTDSAEELDESTLTYRTTEFHALHFLSANPRRDETVRRRFGGRVLRYLREDRENLIRVIFGTFPMRDLPRERRTFNPYEFYRRYFANGRYYLAPFLAILLAGRGLLRLVREVVRLVREVRDPGARATPRRSGHASFEVARRKIHRMRRPIAMEAIRLRAEFDPEYLGLALPDRPTTVPPERQFAADLRALNATEREWEQFRRLKSDRQDRLRRLARVLRLLERRSRSPWPEHDDSRAGEAARSVAIAWICDHDGVASSVEAYERMNELVRRIERTRPEPERRFRFPRFLRIGAPRVRKLLDDAWPHLFRKERGTEDEPLRDRLVDAILGPEVAARSALECIAARERADESDVYESAFHALRVVAAQPATFTEQVVAVRAVHALALLDLEGYERLVEGLGGYGIREDSR